MPDLKPVAEVAEDQLYTSTSLQHRMHGFIEEIDIPHNCYNRYHTHLPHMHMHTLAVS